MTPSETRVVRVGSREYLRVGHALIAVDGKFTAAFKEFVEAL